MNKFDLEIVAIEDGELANRRFYGLSMRQVFRILKGYEETCGRENMRATIRIF